MTQPTKVYYDIKYGYSISPCPYGATNRRGELLMVGAIACKECVYNCDRDTVLTPFLKDQAGMYVLCGALK